MKKLTPTDPLSHSLDLIAENIAKLKALFPQLLTEAKGGAALNVDVLKQLVGDATVTDAEEKYGLNWNGKRKARLEALKPSTGTLRPAKAESVEWDSTQHILIEGDNLEVLKLLQKSYANQVKLIYIDPPYNTGKDFVYPDDYQDNLRNYQELTGTLGMQSNPETSGRFHTHWLNMLFPRLILAHNLLREDGVVCISIDDAELSNLRRVADEVYGEENFIATLVWDRNRKNDAKYFSVGHEYMVLYFKNEARQSEHGVILRGQKEGVEEIRELFEKLKKGYPNDWDKIRSEMQAFLSSIKDDDTRAPLKRFTKLDEHGPYRDDGNINWPGGGGPYYEVLHPITKKPCKLPISGWRFPKEERFWEEVAKGRIVFGADESTVPRLRTNLFDKDSQVMVSVHYSYAQTSANQFSALFDGQRVFDNPKPLNDIKSLVGYITSPDDIILDFFAGSGTTGHAVMAQNALDGGNRRYILVQLPEPLNPAKKEQKTAADFCDQLGVPRTIAELTKERLRRAGKKVKAENPLFHGDTGFRVFKLDSSNLKAWDPNTNTVREDLLSVVEHVKPDRSNDDLLYELLLKKGLDLSVPMEQKTIAGKEVVAIGGGVMLVCLADAMDATTAEPLALGMAAWHKQLAPANDKETVVIFKDSAFDSNVAKSNLTEILKQRGLAKVNSI